VTPEEELEAAVWRAMRTWGVNTPEPVRFIEAVKFAAVRYAAGDSPALTEQRREVLHRDTRPEGQDPPSTRGGVGRDGPELPPLRGSDALGQRVADGGATLSTEASIPGVFTSRFGRLSTAGDGVVHRSVR
jgi:hypothetical protein